MGGYYLQTAVGIIAGAIMCAAWWYAAIKFPRVWILSGLAIVATISLLFYAGMLVLIANAPVEFCFSFGQRSSAASPCGGDPPVLLVKWLVASGKDPAKP